MKSLFTLALAALTLSANSYAGACPALNLPATFTEIAESGYANNFAYSIRSRQGSVVGHTALVCSNSRCYVKLFNSNNQVVAMYETYRSGSLSRTAVYDCNRSRLGVVQITNVNSIEGTSSILNAHGASLARSTYRQLAQGEDTVFTTGSGSRLRVYQPAASELRYGSYSQNLLHFIDSRIVALTPVILSVEARHQRALARAREEASSSSSDYSSGGSTSSSPSVWDWNSSSSSSSSDDDDDDSSSSWGSSSSSSSSGGFSDDEDSSWGSSSSSPTSTGGFGDDESSSSWGSDSSSSTSSGGFGDEE